jgi:hypothetical protein
MFNRTGIVAALVAAVVVWAMATAAPPIARAADGAAASQTAEQAALANARAKLILQAMALPINSAATVGDLVGANERIAAGLQTFIQLLKPSGQPRWDGDRTRVEVDLEVKLVDLYAALRDLHARNYKGEKITAADFARLAGEAGNKSIRQTGSANLPQAPRPISETAPAQAPAFWRAHVTPEGIRQAEDDAQRDARRRLLAQVTKLPLGGGATVRDLLVESGEIVKHLPDVLRTAAQQGPAQYHARDLIVDVTLAVPVADVYDQLKALHARYYKGKQIKAGDFAVEVQAGSTELTAVGSGVPPERFLIGSPKVQPAASRSAQAAPSRPDWPKAVRSSGTAAADPKDKSIAQAKLKAQRDAEDQARAGLSDKVAALSITANTTVGAFAALDPRIAADMKAYLASARLVTSDVSSSGAAKAEVEISTDRLWQIVQFWQDKLGASIP